MNKNSGCHESVGTVVKVRKSTAYIERIKSDACGGCKACILGREGNKLVLPANNEVCAKVGDKVSFTLPPPRPILAIVMLFILPLTLMICALIIPLSLGVSEINSILLSIGGAVVGFAIVLLFDKLIFSRKKATVIKILIKNPQGEII